MKNPVLPPTDVVGPPTDVVGPNGAFWLFHVKGDFLTLLIMDKFLMCVGDRRIGNFVALEG